MRTSLVATAASSQIRNGKLINHTVVTDQRIARAIAYNHNETVVGGQIRYGRLINHNETVVSERRIISHNHNETVIVRTAS